MILESLLGANIVLLCVLVCRSAEQSKAELRLRELELDEQIGIGPIAADVDELESIPRQWDGGTFEGVPHWRWGSYRCEWVLWERVTSGAVVVPVRFDRPTKPPPDKLEKTKDLKWLR